MRWLATWVPWVLEYSPGRRRGRGAGGRRGWWRGEAVLGVSGRRAARARSRSVGVLSGASGIADSRRFSSYHRGFSPGRRRGRGRGRRRGRREGGVGGGDRRRAGGGRGRRAARAQSRITDQVSPGAHGRCAGFGLGLARQQSRTLTWEEAREEGRGEGNGADCTAQAHVAAAAVMASPTSFVDASTAVRWRGGCQLVSINCRAQPQTH